MQTLNTEIYEAPSIQYHGVLPINGLIFKNNVIIDQVDSSAVNPFSLMPLLFVANEYFVIPSASSPLSYCPRTHLPVHYLSRADPSD